MSSLDADIGNKVLNKVFLKKLKEKTLIFVSHNLNLASNSDRIIIFKEGEIIESGNYQELSSNPLSEFNKMSVNLKQNELESLSNAEITEKKINNLIPEKIQEKIKKEKGNLTGGEEKITTGSMPFEIYSKFIKSGNACYLLIFTIFIFFRILCKYSIEFIVGAWAINSFSIDKTYYPILLVIVIILSIFFNLIKTIAYSLWVKNCSAFTQSRFISKLLKAKMSWIDVINIFY